MKFRSNGPRIAYATIAAAALLAPAGPAMASDPYVLDLPAGLACADFGLRIEIFNDAKTVVRTFTDAAGHVVRTLQTGTGNTMRYTNLDTGATYQTNSNGAVQKTKFNSDGSTTYVSTGHTLVIMFPSDVPPGPSTTLYAGQVVMNVDAAGTFTAKKTTGYALDVCATLS